jgi:hypothetical protein
MPGSFQRIVVLLLLASMSSASAAQVDTTYPIHSTARPKPPVVTPAPASAPGRPPSDAIIVFDGTSLTKWRSSDSTAGPAKWRVADGYFEVAPGTGGIETIQGFGDVQLHIEWATPARVDGDGQNRGNSGVFLMGRYEVQILDSYRNETYADGQAAAIYGQYPPLVNASRPPGEWQTYDIVFRRPHFAADGKLQRPARITVLHNGVLVQDGVALSGPSGHRARPPYEAHPDRVPIGLQDHGNPTRFRNVWVRELPETPAARTPRR